jgi:hypothetical protein
VGEVERPRRREERELPERRDSRVGRGGETDRQAEIE